MIFGYPAWYRNLSADRYAPGCSEEDKAEVDALFLKWAETDRKASRDGWIIFGVPIAIMALLNLGLYVWGAVLR